MGGELGNERETRQWEGDYAMRGKLGNGRGTRQWEGN